NYNLFKGLDVTVTAYVGGDTYKVSEKGFEDKGSSKAEYANQGFTAQPIEVRIKVAPYVYDKLDSSLVLDQYHSTTINGESFVVSKITFKGATAANTTSLKLDSTKLAIEAPFVYVGGEYRNAYSGGYLKAGDITYNGYSGQRLYAKLVIGNAISGKQEVYEPIVINALTPNTYDLSIAKDNAFNPEWYSDISTLNIGFKGLTDKHEMTIDWSTIKYYKESKLKTLLKDQNIYAGGTIYATVRAKVMDGNTPIACAKDSEGNYVGQLITLKLSVPVQTISGIKFFYIDDPDDPNCGSYYGKDIYSTKDGAAIVTLLGDEVLLNKDYYTGTVYGQTHKINDVAYGIDPVNFALNPTDYFKIGAWGDAVNGTAVKVELSDSTSYIGFLQGVTVTTSPELSVKGVIGGREMTIGINLADYTPDKAIKDNGSQTVRVRANTSVSALVFDYNARSRWTLPTSIIASTASGPEGGVVQDIDWDETDAPTWTELQDKAIDNNHYIERKYHLFDGTSFETQQYTAKIFITNYEPLDEGENWSVTINGLNTTYIPFTAFAFPTTATLTSPMVGTYTDVPVTWSAGLPTDEEIATGSFTRTAYVGINMKSIEVEFTVAKQFRFKESEGFVTSIVSGNTVYSYALDTEQKLYDGLPREGFIFVGDDDSMEVAVEYFWDVSYTAADGFSGEVLLTVKNENLNVQVPVSLTILSGTKIASFKKVGDNMLVIDQYGMDGTFFDSGAKATVITESGQEVEVTGTYNLPADFYSNASKYFGTILKDVEVTFTYNGGADEVLEEKLTTDLYVLDRTVKYITETAYRSISIDPFLDQDISRFVAASEAGLHITTFKDKVGVVDIDQGHNVYAPTTTFEAYIDWSGVAKLLKDNTSDFSFTTKATTTYTNDAGKEIKVVQTVSVPVTVMNRVIDDVDFDPENEKDELGNKVYDYLYSDYSKTATITDTYRSRTAGEGNYMQIVFYKSAGSFPKQFVFENQFAYKGLAGLPQRVKFTFEDGVAKYYRLTYEGVIEPEDLPLNTTTRRDVKIYAWSGNPDVDPAGDGSDGRFIVRTIEIELVIRPSAVSINNTNIAYTDLSNGEYVYDFDSYPNGATRANSVYGAAFPSTVTYYVGGTFIKLSKWNDQGEVGNSTYTEWTRLHSIYKEALGGLETPYTYDYDEETRTYSKAAANANSFIFVYVTTQTLNATWDLSDLSYGYKGGVAYAKATLTSPVNNKTNTTVKVPVHINSGKAASYTFAGTATGDAISLYNQAGNKFVINPYALSGKVFERLVGTVPLNERYSKDGDEFVQDNEGTYKKVIVDNE
ncbi:MAG: hypothetical protein II867_01050, partial [Clostridia bacterium]|nr:hypothetical protein [Clostridia bacterium]